MTTRQRIVTTYSAKLDVAIRRHLELNPRFYRAARDLEPYTVKRLLLDAMGSDSSPYSAELDVIEQRGTLTRLLREIVRVEERAFCVRHNHWAGLI